MTAPAARRALTPWRSRAMRATVAVWGAAAVVAFAGSLPSAHRAAATVCRSEPCAPSSLDAAAADRLAAAGIPLEVWALIATGFATVFAVTCFAVGGLLLRAMAAAGRAGDVALGSAAVLFALAVAFPQTFEALAFDVPALAPVVSAFSSVSLAALVAWAMTLPDGRLRSHGSVVLLAAAVAYVVIVPIAAVLSIPFLVVAIAGLIVSIAVVVDVVLRFAGRRGARARQGGSAGIVLVAAASAVLALALAGVLQGTVVARGSLGDVVLQVVLSVVFLALPVAVGLAVLRGGLWDERGSLVRVLTAGTTASLLFALFTLGFAAAVSAGLDAAVAAVLVASAVAVGTGPLAAAVREVLRSIAGSPRDASGAVHELSERLALAAEPDTIPRAAAAELVEALGVRDAWIDRDGQTPTPDGAQRFAITHAEGEFGDLVVVPRPLQDLGGARERETLSGVTAYLGAVLAAEARSAELRDAHAELVVAREDERRLLRDELHDELGPLLGSVVFRLRAAEKSLADGPRTLVEESRRDVTDAVAAVRRIAYGLRPPALDEHGLAHALVVFGRSFGQAGFAVAVQDDTAGDPAPSAVQVAAYRIAVEAIANALRHSGGTTCRVRLSERSGDLVIEVEDDGRATTVEPGVGIRSMRERARQVGGSVDLGVGALGGVVVTARLPLAPAGIVEEAS